MSLAPCGTIHLPRTSARTRSVRHAPVGGATRPAVVTGRSNVTVRQAAYCVARLLDRISGVSLATANGDTNGDTNQASTGDADPHSEPVDGPLQPADSPDIGARPADTWITHRPADAGIGAGSGMPLDTGISPDVVIGRCAGCGSWVRFERLPAPELEISGSGFRADCPTCGRQELT